MTPAQADAIRTYTAGVLRARRAYTPDYIRPSPDCNVKGCTNAAWAGRTHCRTHRRQAGETQPNPVQRLTEG